MKSAQTSSGRSRPWGTIFFLILNLAIIGFLVYSEFGRNKSACRLRELRIHPVYLCAAVLCFGLAVWIETLKYQRLLRRAGGRADPRGGLACAILGKYYDNITPLGSGGEPFQIYYLYKRGYDAGVSGALPVAGFLGNQSAFIAIAIAVLAAAGTGESSVIVIRLTAWVGLAMYATIPLFVVIFSLWPEQSGRAVCRCIRLGHRLHLIRDAEKTENKVSETLTHYSASLRLVVSDKMMFSAVALCSLGYRLALLVMPYFVLRTFGVAAPFWQVFCQVVYVNLAMTIVPTPGNAGAAEGSFYLVFSSLTGGELFWAIALWRILSYYSWLGLGLGYYTYKGIRQRRAARWVQ